MKICTYACFAHCAHFCIEGVPYAHFFARFARYLLDIELGHGKKNSNYVKLELRKFKL